MRVLIIEDEAPAFRRLQKLLDEIDPSIEIVDVIDGVKEAVKWFDGEHSVDLIFMDIQLSDGISFDIFEKTSVSSPVIFTTAFDDYMLKAFKVNSIDYLLKPIIQEDLSKSIEKYKSLKHQYSTEKSASIQELIKHIKLSEAKYKERFLIKKGDKLLSIEIKDVAAFQSKYAVVFILAKSGKVYQIDQTLEEVYQLLNPKKYFRVNRNFILNFESIKAVVRLSKGKLLIENTLDQDQQILVSSEKARAFKDWFGQC